MRKDFLVAVFMTSLLLTGCERLERTSKTGAEPQAIAKSADIPTITLDLLSEDLVGQTVQITGKVVQQCPSSGCWFKLQAGERETFVDLNSSSVRLSQNRVGQQVRITGEVAKRGSDLTLNGQQVEFMPSQQGAPQDREAGAQ